VKCPDSIQVFYDVLVVLDMVGGGTVALVLHRLEHVNISIYHNIAKNC
jgi:hypothetical protein